MKKKQLTKKTLSVFLAVMMLMTSWVFFPGMVSFEAEAIDAGDAVAAYNKELLNQINTTVDTNMDKAYGKFLIAGNGDNGSDYNADRAAKSYVNVLYSPYLYNTSTPAATFGTVTNADRVAVWYPTTVLMYDGGTARMAVLLEVDSSSAGALRVISAWMSANQNGLEFDGSYQAGSNTGNENHWKGYTDNGDSSHAYIMYSDADKYYASANGTEHSSYKFNVAKGKWGFIGGHLKFTGTLSDTEWVRTIKPTWNFWGGKDGSTKKYTGTTNNPIYVMNIQGYKKLVQDIISKKGSLNGKEGQYTRDSLQKFVNACNKITKDLAPKNFVSTTSNNVTSWASQMSTAYTELNNAYNGLVKRNVNVGYENLFSISDWAQSLSPNLQSSSSVEIAVENNDTVKIYKNSAGGEVTTGSSYPNAHVATRYSIPVTGGKDYTVRYDIEASVSGTAQSEVFMFWYDANNNPVNNTAGSATFNNKGFGSTGACSVTFTAPASATKAEIRFDNDCPSSGSTLRFKNIAVYPAERNTAVEVDSWSTRPVMKTVQYGSTLSGKLDVPVRDGYTFNGWYIDNVNVNGVKDSGEEVTDAAGNVTKSVTVTNSINLYADWKPLPMDIGYDNIFSLAEWAKTGSTKLSAAGNLTYDVMAGTITVESTGTGETYTTYNADGYTMDVKPNTEYVFSAKMTTPAGSTQKYGQMFIFCYDANGNGVNGPTEIKADGSESTYSGQQHIGIYPSTDGVSTIKFRTPADCYKLRIRVGATASGVIETYSDIAVYEKSAYDAYAKDYATIRVPFNFGDTTGLSLVPTREGYQFDGWYTANGTKLTSVTGLKASDTVYAKWVQMFTVTFKNWNGDVIKTQEVAPGANATAPANPVKDPDTNTEYVFDVWDTAFTNVQSDLTVTAVFKTKDHSLVKSYLSGSTCTAAATYTQYCTSCNFTWNGVLEDAAMPALGHTYDRAEPTFTVITGTSTGGKDTDLHTIKCNECDATKTVVHNFQLDAAHPATSATCIVPGETYYKCACLETKTEVGNVNPDNHVNTKIINAVAAECEKPGYTGDTFCNDCQKTVATGKATDALKHVYTTYTSNGDATCFADGTESALCDLCKDETKKATRTDKGSQLTHKYTNYVYDEGTAKCEVNGTETASCDHGCGTKDTREAANSALKHDFTGAYKNNENGTHSFLCKNGCGNYGATVDCVYGAWTTDNATTHSHTCTTCGYTPAAEAHDWSAWTTVGGSGTEKATQTRSCNVCGKVENTECNYVVEDHKDATCEAAELTTYKCSDCGHGYTVIGASPKGHNFNGTAKNNNNGTHSFACANGCGEYGFETTKNMGVPCSDWTYANTEAGKHTATCKTCGYVKTEDCSGGTASCTAQAVCQFCNTAYGTTADHVLTGTEKYLKKATDATCIANETYYKYCIGCENVFSDTETYEKPDTMTEHDYTCTDEYLYIATQEKCGVNETYYAYCSNPDCKKSSEDANNTFEKAGTALEHNFVNAVSNNDGTHTKACNNTNTDGWACTETKTYKCEDYKKQAGVAGATCTEKGFTLYECLECEHTWKADYVDALGHDYTEKNNNNEAYVKVPANCDHGTIIWYGCSRCDKNAKDETDTEKYPVLFYENPNDIRTHSWKNVAAEAYIATPATCTAAPKYYPSCSYEDCTAIDTSKTFSSGTALEHAFDKKVETYPATDANCVNNATYYYVCSRCDVKGTTTWEKENSKSGHALTHTAAVPADCEKAGNYEYWYCATCKKYFKDKDATEVFANQAATVIAKLGHDIVKVIYKPATCEVDGNPAYEYCTRCSYTTYPAVLPDGYKATGHNFTGEWTYDTVQLYHSKLCVNGCGKSGMVIDGAQVEYKVTYNELDEAVVEGAEKCTFTYEESTVDGVHSHVNECVCGNNNSKTYTDEETFVETVAPTCTDKGYDSYACKDCGATWTKNEKPANGHTAAENATSNGDGTHSVYCTVEGCGYQISTEKCSGGTATCSAQAVCDKCKTAYGETGAHVYAEGSVWVYQNDATCGVNGTEKNTCTVCKEEQTREAKGTALTHVMSDYVSELPEGVTIKGFDASQLKAPTCKEQGFEVRYCTLGCGHYQTRTVQNDKNSHVWAADESGEIVWTLVGGDCSTGVTLANKCTVCDKTQTKVETGTHTWEIKFDAKPNCTETGFRIWKCSTCDFTFDEFYGYNGIYLEQIEALVNPETGEHYSNADLATIGDAGHSFAYTNKNKDATCTEAEKEIWKCAHCDKLEYRDIAGKEALGHKIYREEANEADCVFEGNVEYYYCARCEATFADADATTALENVIIPTKSHADGDGNGKCDECNRVLYDTDDGQQSSCGCICHKDNALMKILYKILNFFWKLFKISRSCDCGYTHW